MKFSNLEEPDQYVAIAKMELYGGSFATAIALAWYRADMFNREKLNDTFDDMFTMYANMPTSN